MFVRGDGPVPCRILAVGEGPGKNEERAGLPFVGRAGDLLTDCLFRQGISRDKVFLTNVVRQRCVTPDGRDRPPTPAEIKRDEKYLIQDLIQVKPEIITTLGRTATQWFMGDVDMEAVHGLPVYRPGYEKLKSQVILPCYHPAAALHDTSGEMAALVYEDIRQLGRLVRGEIQPRVLRDAYANPLYQELTTPQQVAQVLPYPSGVSRRPLFVDTEGVIRPRIPWSIQFALDPGHGYLIRVTSKAALAEFWERARHYRWKIHNALGIDLAIFDSLGMDLDAAGVPYDDTMLMAYLDRLEPQGLKPLAFRWASMQMQSYDDLTDAASRRLLVDFLRRATGRVYPKPDPVMERASKTGEWKIRQPQDAGRRVDAIIRDVDSGKLDKAGEPVDPRKRWEQVEAPLRAHVEEQIDPTPIFTLDKLPIEEVIRYGCRDSDAQARVTPALESRMAEKGLLPLYEMKRAILPMVYRMMKVGMLIDRQHFLDMRGDIEREQDRLDLEIKKHTGSQWLNVDSMPQVSALLYGKLRLESEILTKKGRVPSTNDKALEALVGTHPVVGLIIDRREANTIDGFARDLPEHADAASRIHCTLRITRVAQGRLAASKPNLLGIPVRSELGKRIRSGFVAPGGKHLGSADESQIEMMVMADESSDETLVRQICEGKDTHAETAIDILGCSRADSTDPKYREPAKRVQFGIITGITEVGLYEQLRMNHIEGYSKRDCAEMLRDYFRLRPGVAKYISACKSEARRNGYVRDRWGMYRYLPGVWSDVPYVRAEAERQSHSHKISGGAQGIIQRAMGRIWRRLVDEIWPAGVYCEILLQVHDELIWEGEGDPGDWPSQLISGVIVEELLAETKLFKVPLKAKASTALTWGGLK